MVDCEEAAMDKLVEVSYKAEDMIMLDQQYLLAPGGAADGWPGYQ